MIIEHQPKIFPSRIIVRVSSASDGNVKHTQGFKPSEVTQNRKDILGQCGIDMKDTNLVRISYDRDDYCRYAIASVEDAGVSMHPEHDTEVCDALATGTPGQGLFLPIADCCALVLADIRQDKIMLSHVGRHSAAQNGARRSVEFMRHTYGSVTEDIVAWLSPAAGKENFPIYSLNNKGLHEAILEQLREAGMTDDHIEVSTIDTTVDDRYFSHSEYLKGHRLLDGRFAVVAAIER